MIAVGDCRVILCGLCVKCRVWSRCGDAFVVGVVGVVVVVAIVVVVLGAVRGVGGVFSSSSVSSLSLGGQHGTAHSDAVVCSSSSVSLGGKQGSAQREAASGLAGVEA